MPAQVGDRLAVGHAVETRQHGLAGRDPSAALIEHLTRLELRAARPLALLEVLS